MGIKPLDGVLEQLTEFDINPVVVFNPTGEIGYYNREAEILLANVEPSRLFQFGMERLPNGQKEVVVEFQPFQMGELEFTGWWIGIVREWLVVKLLVNTTPRQLKLGELELVDLTLLLEWAVDYFKLLTPTQKWELELDPTIPLFYFNKKEFIRLLKIVVVGRKWVKIKTKVVVGEYIKIKTQKYPTIEIGIEVEKPIPLKNPYFNLVTFPKGYQLRIPLIKESDESSFFG